MEKKTETILTSGLMLPALMCEMLSLCTSEERHDLLKGLSGISNRSALGALFNALYKGSEPVADKTGASRVTAALSVPACVVINRILSKRQ